MSKFTEQQINNIYLRCNSMPLQQLLDFCLDPETGITIEGLRAVGYKKIDLLEQKYNEKAEEMIWAKSQNSIEALQAFIAKCEQGVFSTTHLLEAKSKLRNLAAALEEDDWNKARLSNDVATLLAFVKKCSEGIYSPTHMAEAKTMAETVDWNSVRFSNNVDAISAFIQKCETGVYSQLYVAQAKNLAEGIEWESAKASRKVGEMNGFITKCKMGIYSGLHLSEANQLLETWENGVIIEDWNNLVVIRDTDLKRNKLNEFIQKYSTISTETAMNYIRKANDMMNQLADAEQARIDWIDTKEKNTILAYVNFLSQHPYCEYREEAEQRIQDMKGDLLADMKRAPFKYTREMMFDYINSKALTMEDLVDKSHVLTDRGFSHIKRYPHLVDEQRQLPVSKIENPQSEAGNTDFYFFGVSGSGKTCVLAGLMSLTGQLGFRFDPKGPGGGGNYAMELRNYATTSMLPPATDQSYIQVIDAQIKDEDGSLRKISFIEMSGEKTARFASLENAENLEDLGPGAASLLSNDNYKVFFFVIDPTNEKTIELGEGNQIWVQQSDVLNCVSSLLSKHKNLMKKVVAIHVIVTKSDTLGDYVDPNIILDLLNKQGYQAVLADIKSICQKFDINKQTGFQVGMYPFCVGKFMPGDVYTFDETDSLKIMRVIQKNSVPVRAESWLDALGRWFNS